MITTYSTAATAETGTRPQSPSASPYASHQMFIDRLTPAHTPETPAVLRSRIRRAACG